MANLADRVYNRLALHYSRLSGEVRGRPALRVRQNCWGQLETRTINRKSKPVRAEVQYMCLAVCTDDSRQTQS